jgi:hypothetical protein
MPKSCRGVGIWKTDAEIIFRLCKAYCVLTGFIPRPWERRWIHSEITFLRLKGEWCKCTRALRSFSIGGRAYVLIEILARYLHGDHCWLLTFAQR